LENKWCTLISGVQTSADLSSEGKKLSCYRPGQPLGLQKVEAPRTSRQSAHEGPMRRQPLTPGDIPGTHFCSRLSPLQGHSAAGMIRSMKNLNDHKGNQTSNLLICSTAPQYTVQ